MTATRISNTVFLVDAFALIFQVFHAIREMTGPSGMPTNALFGFTRDLLYLHQEVRPEYLVCAFDVGDPTIRLEVYPEYKANRDEMPETLRLQLPAIEQLLDAMNVPRLGCEGYEADDLIATLAVESEKLNRDVRICSSDKDMRQLISDRVKIFSLRKRTEMGTSELMDDWGVRPDQVVDLQTMVGDSVDNISGVPGIGVKTAAKLLQEFQTLEGVLQNVDNISGPKRRENIRNSADLFERNRKLVKLDCQVPIEMDWELWSRKSLNVEALLELFREWGFHRFADQVAPKKSTTSPAKDGLEQPGLFGGDEQERPTLASKKQWVGEYKLVDSVKEIDLFLEKVRNQPRIAFDLETTGAKKDDALNPWAAEIVGYAFSWQKGEGWYLPVRAPDEEQRLDPGKTLNALKPIFENADVEKINQNIKFDAMVLQFHGVSVKGIAGDSMVADYLLNPGERSRKIEEISRRILDHEMIPIETLIGKSGPKQKRMNDVSVASIAEYAGEDADVAWRLCEVLESRLANEEFSALYHDLEIPLIDVLIELEHNGIRLDVKLLKEFAEELGEKISEIEERIYELAGERFNIASLNQLRRVLFGPENLALKPVKKTGKTGLPSTDHESLERLFGEHDIIKELLDYREFTKLKSTYVDALPLLVNPKSGRLHTSFQQTIAATGRLSSTDPNLQNIPIRTELGGRIRQAFVPQEGWDLISADYSQVELRMLAHFCGDEELRRAFREDRDVHSLVASQIYGVAENAVSSEMRRMAKTVNFGVIYGMSAFGLARRLRIKREDAEAFIESYFKQYPSILEYQQTLLANCREVGYVSTILGRRRKFSREAIREETTYRSRNPGEREAINMEIQGSAADLIKTAMLNLYRRLRKESLQTRMLLQIHDELVFESPPNETERVVPIIREEMLNALNDRLEVALKVDVGVGPNWLDVKN